MVIDPIYYYFFLIVPDRGIENKESYLLLKEEFVNFAETFVPIQRSFMKENDKEVKPLIKHYAYPKFMFMDSWEEMKDSCWDGIYEIQAQLK